MAVRRRRNREREREEREKPNEKLMDEWFSGELGSSSSSRNRKCLQVYQIKSFLCCSNDKIDGSSLSSCVRSPTRCNSVSHGDSSSPVTILDVFTPVLGSIHEGQSENGFISSTP